MKTIIDYKELSQLTEGKFTFKQVSETSINISGVIKILMIPKNISMVFTIERVGFSSITLSTDNQSIISMGLMFIPDNLKKAVANLGEGKIKIDLRSIPELHEITKRLKIDSLKFEESNIIIEISPRP